MPLYLLNKSKFCININNVHTEERIGTSRYFHCKSKINKSIPNNKLVTEVRLIYVHGSVHTEIELFMCLSISTATTTVIVSLQIGNHIYTDYVVVQFYPWFKFYFPLFKDMVMYNKEFQACK